MKKRVSLFFLLCALCLFSCIHISHGGNTDIKFSESDYYYSMRARFNDSKTRSVEYYMDNEMGSRSNISFVNTRIDGRIAFDDHTNFYIKKYPGYLLIKLNKGDNTHDSYERVRRMCEGIKDLLAK